MNENNIKKLLGKKISKKENNALKSEIDGLYVEKYDDSGIKSQIKSNKDDTDAKFKALNVTISDKINKAVATHISDVETLIKSHNNDIGEMNKKLEIEVSMELMENILSQVSTTAVLEILEDEHVLYPVCETILERILFYMKKRIDDKAQIECILYENSFGTLAKSKKAELFLLYLCILIFYYNS